jgi:hypothetical protein
MQPFDPWLWRDPAALAGGYEQATPGAAPPPGSSPSGPSPTGPSPTGSSSGGASEDERGALDLSGYTVQATDGRVGTVDETGASGGAGWLVVDTGPWIFGRKVILPVGTVTRVDHLDRAVHVDRSRDEVKHSPEYDPDTFDTPGYRQAVGRYYEDSYRAR